MTPFRFVEAESPEHAASMLDDRPSIAMPLAGGTDLLSEIKEGVVGPATLVNLASVEGLSGIYHADEGVTIGAMTTLAELADDEGVEREYAALAEAVASVATPQLRNVGTVGGNLCQRPRCWYYRSPLFDCRKKGGDICFAIEGNSKFHAILGGIDCYIVHPSDLAPVLVALDASAEIAGPNGRRTLPIEKFFVGPEHNVEAETALETGEIAASVFVPKPSNGHRSAYLKARERQTQEFALASVAASLQVRDGIIERASLVLGGVAPTPWRATNAEDALRGLPVTRVDPDTIGQMAVQGAKPLRDNRYKVRLTASLVARALRTLLDHEDT